MPSQILMHGHAYLSLGIFFGLSDMHEPSDYCGVQTLTATVRLATVFAAS